MAFAALAAACASRPDATTPVCPAPGPRDEPGSAFPIEGDAERGRELFAEHCAACHAPSREARAEDAPPHAPRLDCPAWLARAGDAYLYRTINLGPGGFGHGGGPSLGVALMPQDTADLVAHLRSLQTP